MSNFGPAYLIFYVSIFWLGEMRLAFSLQVMGERKIRL